MPFDFKTLRDLDFFDDVVPAVAEAGDEPSSLLAICDTEMAQPVDPADDALALQLESADVHVPSAPGLTCPRCTDDREPPDHNNFDLDKAWQHLPTAPMSLSGMYDTTPNDKAATAPSAREFREAHAGRKDKKKGKKGKANAKAKPKVRGRPKLVRKVKAKTNAKPFVAIATASPGTVEQRRSSISSGDPIF